MNILAITTTNSNSNVNLSAIFYLSVVFIKKRESCVGVLKLSPQCKHEILSLFLVFFYALVKIFFYLKIVLITSTSF